LKKKFEQVIGLVIVLIYQRTNVDLSQADTPSNVFVQFFSLEF